jgi:hypothetical protein
LGDGDRQHSKPAVHVFLVAPPALVSSSSVVSGFAVTVLDQRGKLVPRKLFTTYFPVVRRKYQLFPTVY